MPLLKKLFPTIEAEAHCDIPCGIYDPTSAKIAAKTVARMVEQIEELALPKDEMDKHAIDHYHQATMRRMLVKEQQAELCKRELEILMTDFFKPEHLEQFPDLHELFWQATKLCSKNKQELSGELANQLVKAVDAIAEKFYAIKKAPERFEAYKTITDNLY